MSTREAALAGYVLHRFWDYVETNPIGLPVGAFGAFRLKLNLVRIPDVAFISWIRFPEGELPDEAIASRVPELAAEVLSESNTPKEIELKLEEYFKAGVQLAWVIDPKTQTGRRVHLAHEMHRHVGKSQALERARYPARLHVALETIVRQHKTAWANKLLNSCAGHARRGHS